MAFFTGGTWQLYPAHLTTFIVRTWLLYVLYLATFSCPLDYIYLVHLAAFFSVLDYSFSALVWGLGFQVIRGVGCCNIGFLGAVGLGRQGQNMTQLGLFGSWSLGHFLAPENSQVDKHQKVSRAVNYSTWAFPSLHLTIFSTPKVVK